MNGRKKASPSVTFDPQAEIAEDRALVPAVMRLNEQRVVAGFWPKIRKVAARVPFAREVLSVWYCAQDEETPLAAKGMAFAALAYFVMPVDAIPDFIAGIGYTDDAAVFAALLAILGKNLKPRHKDAARRAIDGLRDD
ncbi:YkvA family protein [Phenylobacterium sp.]|uniref:YkvA family protein n=1 Tax=Phenylobacterium sp. TaxID=1871053 RepID=UPI0025DF7016|nr:YkvA family protein [Phenylobacterium sp.]